VQHPCNGPPADSLRLPLHSAHHDSDHQHNKTHDEAEDDRGDRPRSQAHFTAARVGGRPTLRISAVSKENGAKYRQRNCNGDQKSGETANPETA